MLIECSSVSSWESSVTVFERGCPPCWPSGPLPGPAQSGARCGCRPRAAAAGRRSPQGGPARRSPAAPGPPASGRRATSRGCAWRRCDGRQTARRPAMQRREIAGQRVCFCVVSKVGPKSEGAVAVRRALDVSVAVAKLPIALQQQQIGIHQGPQYVVGGSAVCGVMRPVVLEMKTHARACTSSSHICPVQSPTSSWPQCFTTSISSFHEGAQWGA